MASYSSFFGAEINDPGTVAISANLTGGGQVLLAAGHGTLDPFVDTTGAYLQIRGAGEVSINNNGEIIFGATLDAGGRGFFDGPDPFADRIIAIGDALAGSTVVDLPMNAMNPRALNNAGQFLFRADLADGRRILVRAESDGSGHAGGGGYQSEHAVVASFVLTAGPNGLSPFGDSMSSTVALPLSPAPGDVQGLIAGGFAPTTPATAPADAARLDQLFATGMEEETSLFSPNWRRNSLSVADDLGVDLVFCE